MRATLTMAKRQAAKVRHLGNTHRPAEVEASAQRKSKVMFKHSVEDGKGL